MFTSALHPHHREALIGLHQGSFRIVPVEGESWYATRYTVTHLATDQTLRECWAEGHGDAMRMYVAADGTYYID